MVIVTRKEVAAAAGVSEATVSRVFNGVGPMREETRRRVLKAAEALNYHPNAIAQNFARRRSGNIGVVLPYVPKVRMFSTYYFSEVLSGIGEQAKKSGYDMLLMFRSQEDEEGYSRLFHSHKVDGCLILGATDTPQERNEIAKLEQNDFPYCLINQRYEGESFHLVEADHEQGSYEAVRYLIQQGYRQIAFLNGPKEYSNSGDRYRGYVRALKEAGILSDNLNRVEDLPEGTYYEGNYSRTSGVKAAAAMGPYMKRIDAVFAANDRMAFGLIQGLKEHGYQPGRDYAIIGYDDSEAARATDPPLTSVSVPFYEMGRLAAQRLIEQLGGADAEHGYKSGERLDERLETRLIVRQSVPERKPN